MKINKFISLFSEKDEINWFSHFMRKWDIKIPLFLFKEKKNFLYHLRICNSANSSFLPPADLVGPVFGPRRRSGRLDLCHGQKGQGYVFAYFEARRSKVQVWAKMGQIGQNGIFTDPWWQNDQNWLSIGKVVKIAKIWGSGMGLRGAPRSGQKAA